MPQNIIEPNNIYRQEICAGANQTEAWDGAWGWSDTKCEAKFPFMCRKNREFARGLHASLKACFFVQQMQPGPCLRRPG